MPPRIGRFVLAALLIVSSVVIQVAVLSRLPLPGATPDLVLVVVGSWALARGSVEGAIVGFAAGLTLDLVPPSDGPLGLTAFVLALMGYLVGLAADDAQRSALAPLVIMTLASVLALVLWAGLAVLVGDERVTWGALGDQLLAQALYTVVLTPLVLPFVHAMLRRLEPAVNRW
jgi:rod shape-determining protein MreD